MSRLIERLKALERLALPESEAGKLCRVIFLPGSTIDAPVYVSAYPAWLNADERIEPVPLTTGEANAAGVGGITVIIGNESVSLTAKEVNEAGIKELSNEPFQL